MAAEKMSIAAEGSEDSSYCMLLRQPNHSVLDVTLSGAVAMFDQTLGETKSGFFNYRDCSCCAALELWNHLGWSVMIRLIFRSRPKK